LAPTRRSSTSISSPSPRPVRTAGRESRRQSRALLWRAPLLHRRSPLQGPDLGDGPRGASQEEVRV
jgi:hypothetical protein